MSGLSRSSTPVAIELRRRPDEGKDYWEVVLATDSDYIPVPGTLEDGEFTALYRFAELLGNVLKS